MGHYAMGGERAVAIRQKPVQVGGSLPGCQDADASCEEWAASGESTPARGASAAALCVGFSHGLPALPHSGGRQLKALPCSPHRCRSPLPRATLCLQASATTTRCS